MNLPDFLFFCVPVPSVHAENQAHRSKLRQQITSIWQHCWHWLMANQEPTVWQETDRRGQVVAWHVYDPLSGHKSCFGTELEVRLWLEQQYNG